MAAMFVIFTYVHGPTSFDLDSPFLGKGTFFWGVMTSTPPNLLVALGLILLYPQLVQPGNRLARSGFNLTLIGLVVPAISDLILGALGPPLLIPLLGIGLILLGVGSRHNPWMQSERRTIVLLIGSLLLLATASFFIPQEVSDSFSGYRIFGILVYFLPGLNWAWFGANLWRDKWMEG
jgi:small-conductance mechanosensitive channel